MTTPQHHPKLPQSPLRPLLNAGSLPHAPTPPKCPEPTSPRTAQPLSRHDLCLLHPSQRLPLSVQTPIFPVTIGGEVR